MFLLQRTTALKVWWFYQVVIDLRLIRAGIMFCATGSFAVVSSISAVLLCEDVGNVFQLSFKAHNQLEKTP